MSVDDDHGPKGTFVFTDIDNQPITCDNNPARFEGLLAEIADCCKRKGKFTDLLEHRMVTRGHRMVIEHPSAIPFIKGQLQNLRSYSPEDPCPPTSRRVAEHNAYQMSIGSPTVTPMTQLPPSSEFTVNPSVVKQEDLALGESIAACFPAHTNFIARVREQYGMGGHALIEHLKALASLATPAERALVLVQFTKFAEAPVPHVLDAQSFETWYKGLNKVHRALPASARKSDSTICNYLNILMYAQPEWRNTFEQRMSGPDGRAAEGDLDLTLQVIRRMLGGRQTYAQLDAEQQGPSINTSLIASHGPSSGLVAGGGNKGGTNESNSIKRAFAALVNSGDTAAAFAVATQAGFSRATSDPKKTGAGGGGGGGGGGGDGEKFIPLPRDASGRITKWVAGGKPCFCGLPHLHRDCNALDMWKQDKEKKWHWVGGKGWVNGNPPAGFNRAAAAGKTPKTAPNSTGKTHDAKVVDHVEECGDDSDLATQMAQIANKLGIDLDDSAQAAKVVVDSGATETVTGYEKYDYEVSQISDQHDIVPETGAPAAPEAAAPEAAAPEAAAPEAAAPATSEPDVVSINTDADADADAAPAVSFETRLRNLASDGMSMISANYCTIIFVAIVAVMVAVLFIPFVQGLSGPMTLTNSGSLHPAYDKVPASAPVRPDHQGLAVDHLRPVPRAAASWFTFKAFFGLFGCLVFNLIYFKLYALLVTVHFPVDVLRALTYCAAAPLAICPAAYCWTLGLGPDRKKDSFFCKAVCSINKLRVFKGPFSLLTFAAIFLSRFSPLAATPPVASSVAAIVSAPEFAVASNSPEVTNVALPFLGKWLPAEVEAGGGSCTRTTRPYSRYPPAPSRTRPSTSPPPSHCPRRR